MKLIKNIYWDKADITVSIIIPIYNRTKTIRRAMISLEKQTSKKFECILIDDGSKDDIDEVIYSFFNKIKLPMLYIKKGNGGVHTARNIGIYYARGEYTMFLDSDDEYRNDAIELMIKAWEKIPYEDRGKYREIVAQCQDQTGNRVGKPFPVNINKMPWKKAVRLCDSTKGEHVSIMKTCILKDNPWPEPEGVTFVTEDIVWKHLEKKYKSFFVNDMIRIYHTNTQDSYTNHKTRTLQYCVNCQWNEGYMLDHWSVYKGKVSYLKRMMIYEIFSMILRKNGVKGYKFNSIINNIVGGAMCGVAFIGANIYMQKHNVS